MIDVQTYANGTSRTGATTVRHPDAANTLVDAIRKPLDALEGAAGEAANGRLGGAKLALLVAVTGLIDALNAVDAEFARQFGPFTAGRPGLQPDRDGPATQHVSRAR
ncbi:MAG: hypothetical protein ABJA98_27030 [Acidobacteriota bacterium]